MNHLDLLRHALEAESQAARWERAEPGTPLAALRRRDARELRRLALAPVLASPEPLAIDFSNCLSAAQALTVARSLIPLSATEAISWLVSWRISLYDLERQHYQGQC